MGDYQNYGPFLGPYYNTGPNTGPNLGDPKRDHNFDNPPCKLLHVSLRLTVIAMQGASFARLHPARGGFFQVKRRGEFES